jgi:hypothetical protein
MFFGDHSPPHFHAIYGEHNALFDLRTLDVIEGDLPKRALKLVKEWAELYLDDLQNIWDTQNFRKLPPLE